MKSSFAHLVLKLYIMTLVEGDYLLNESFFFHERSEWEKSNAVKISLHTSFIRYFLPRELKNHVNVPIFKFDWFERIFFQAIFQ